MGTTGDVSGRSVGSRADRENENVRVREGVAVRSDVKLKSMMIVVYGGRRR